MPNKIIRQREEGEPTVLPNGKPEIVSSGKFGALLRLPVLIDRGDGYFEMDFEQFKRTPGVRVIALQEKNILLTKEFRQELNDFDYRLPGGKVFDSLDAFLPYITEEKPVEDEHIIAKAKDELKEEASKTAQELSIFKKSHCGTTMVWDLHYVVAKGVSDFTEETENEGEQVEEVVWKSFEEVQEMCLNGIISEDRTVATLLQFIKKNT